MAYRFTNTEKWGDSWFSTLKPNEMLLFLYLCDNCDIAGFIEINHKRWASDLNLTLSNIEKASKGLQRGFIFSADGSCLFIRNFLKHQKNLPLNESNKAHIGILKRFELYRYKFGYEDIDTFIQSPIKAPSKGLRSPTGIGIGNDMGINGSKVVTWRDDFNVYLQEASIEFEKAVSDKKFLSQQQDFYPNLHLPKTIQKSWTNYWGTEKGWKKKKSSKTVNIDWRDTITNALSLSMNKVYLTKQEQLDLR
jgi:hypothetical protein